MHSKNVFDNFRKNAKKARGGVLIHVKIFCEFNIVNGANLDSNKFPPRNIIHFQLVGNFSNIIFPPKIQGVSKKGTLVNFVLFQF